MAMTQAQLVDRAFYEIDGGSGPADLRDSLNAKVQDALQDLGELVSDSPKRHLLTRDFQVLMVSGSGDLSAVTLVGGAALSTANIYSLIFDTIKRGKATHGDSTEPVQWEGGGTQAVDKDKLFKFGYLYGTVSADAIYLRREDGTVVTDGACVFKSSFTPTITAFAGTGLTELEEDLVSVLIKRVVGGQQPQAQGAPA